MTSRLIPFSTLKTQTWSSGTSSEVYIYPDTSNFNSLDFDLRISIATVEQDNSIFTPLNGVSRILCPVEGSQHLFHENHHEVLLKPFDQDFFSGDWNTKCIGTSINLNVMHRTGKASIRHMSINKASKYTIVPSGTVDLIFIAKGQAIVDGEVCKAKDSILLHDSVDISIEESGDILHIEYLK